jgi:ribonuclease Z
MIEQITGVSTIYHDCTYSETDKERAKKHFHSTAAQAANTAKQAEAGTLILGHFSARYNNENILLEEAKEIFKNSYLAKENATFTIE